MTLVLSVGDISYACPLYMTLVQCWRHKLRMSIVHDTRTECWRHKLCMLIVYDTRAECWRHKLHMSIVYDTRAVLVA